MIKGFDRYHRNPSIDYDAAKKEGFLFVIHKAAEGVNYQDPSFQAEKGKSLAAGLITGAYQFARPKTSGAAEEFAAYEKVVGSFEGLLPPILDLEDADTGFNKVTMQNWTRQWLTVAKLRTGKTPILYTYPSFAQQYGLSALADLCHLWIASYRDAPQLGGFPAFTFQQYTDGATVADAHPICADYFNGTPEALQALASSAAKSSDVVTSKPKEEPKPAAAPNSYKVKAGDTLTAIAAKFKTTVAALVHRNKIANPDIISVGQELKLSDNVDHKTEPQKKPTPTATAVNTRAPRIHYVQSGETLSGVSGRYDVPVKIIARWNHIADPNKIAAGQKLILPHAHRVRAGETLSKLVGSDYPDVAKANGINPNRLSVGQTIYI